MVSVFFSFIFAAIISQSNLYEERKEAIPYFGPAIQERQVNENLRLEVRKLYLKDETDDPYATSEHYILSRYFDPTDIPYATPRILRKINGHTVDLKLRKEICLNRPILQLKYKAGGAQTILELLYVQVDMLTPLYGTGWASNMEHLQWINPETLEVKNHILPIYKNKVSIERFSIKDCNVQNIFSTIEDVN